MNLNFILTSLQYVLPALIVAGLAYVFFQKILEKQAQRDRFILAQLSNKETGIDTKALKLQACERLVIYAERSDLKKLILRVQPLSTDTQAYAHLLVQHLEQEYEYNVTQQLYVSPELWAIVVHTKNALITTIQQTSKLPEATSAMLYQNLLLNESLKIQNKVDILLRAIKEETAANL
ncbi:DUF7935 family protein [Myroides odoratus]|jgi:hypothetical protein|uniref:Uncharacterized protein n=1 Tax=Myroides odoratus TaxID=256 RepID=A0A9Q7EBQ1_MYROD|nr:hypothetical protein [Myroides odoratus]EHQ44337.1 hypothetical protein Myrod_3540 [Myroides odoratus DSM 2801]EKB04097.1 hypothetical protein HMPREF9716_03349 [Myroides odoratus CIP 103059]QQU01609.1 hypothetical protein I6I88_07710 [Myroides odoratus]WQD56110.1 hypothetical protein U0010_11275 [Myroides odoratus]STZ31676.1 Uncharacterised protein [Myroides odoratus]